MYSLSKLLCFSDGSSTFSEGSSLESFSEGSSPVMLQSFSKNTHGRNLYKTLNSKISKLSKYYKYIWLPPPSQTKDDWGYMPQHWYTLDNNYGNANEQKSLLATMESNNISAIADIVINHRQGEGDSWGLFTDEDGNIQDTKQFVVKGDKLWTDGPESCKNLGNDDIDGYNDICSNAPEDECCNSVLDPVGSFTSANCEPSSMCYDPYGFARRLAHENSVVGDAIVDYLKFLKDVGYNSWRYDFVKGYSAKYVKKYNSNTSPLLSIGEFWDPDPQLTLDWATEANSKVFDFPLRSALRTAFTNSFSVLNNGGKPPGVMGMAATRAVTFIENHDTHKSEPFPMNTEKLGYVYILTHPGIPCVYAPHDPMVNGDGSIDDFDPSFMKDDIQTLIDIRYNVGVQDDANTVNIDTANDSLYAAYIKGSNGTIAMKLGSGDWSPDGDGWNKTSVCGDQNGIGYCVWKM
jgi:glycosidase